MMKKANFIQGTAAVLTTLIFLAPFYISVVYSVKSPIEIAESGLSFPRRVHLENFREAVEISHFAKASYNSVIVTAAAVILQIGFSSLAAYPIARLGRKGNFYSFLYFMFLAAIMIPFQVVQLPLYALLRDLHLLNTRVGLITAIAGFHIAYDIFLFTGFIKAIPPEMEESASIDGAGKYRTFGAVLFPLMKPILSTALILNALAAWNEFPISLIIAQKEYVRTIPLTQFFFFGEHSVHLNLAFAAFVLSMIPIIALYLLMQKYIVGGLMAGAVKG